MLLWLLACADPPCDSPRYVDADGDGFGDVSRPADACEGVALPGDCDDADAAVHPAATEACNGGLDDDCDGLVDDADLDVDGVAELHLDEDGDGFGAGFVADVGCPRDGYTADATDCDDGSAWVYPGAPEWCDGADTDCDAATDEAGLATFWTIDGPSDLTATLAGADHAAVELPTQGSLYVCAGEWPARLRLAASIDVIGPAGAEATILAAGGAGTAVEVTADSLLSRVMGLTLAGGLASVDVDGDGVLGGGGLSCTGTGVLETDGVVVGGARGDQGGALSSSGCDVYLWGGSLHDNGADVGGAAWVRDGHIEFNAVALEDNLAASAGGAIYVDARDDYTFLAITDLVATGNHAPIAGAYAVYGDGEVQIYGIATDRSGILANTSDAGGAVVVGPDALVEFIRADLGVDGGDDDNAPADVSTPAGDYDFDDDITGWCTVTGCTLKEELP